MLSLADFVANAYLSEVRGGDQLGWWARILAECDVRRPEVWP